MIVKKPQLVSLVAVSVVTVATILILFFFYWSNYAKNTLIDNVIFKPGSQMWIRFNSTDDIKDLRLNFFAYNVTNANEVVNGKGNVKIKVKEVGPFVYDILKTKDFLNVNETTGLATYKLRTRYIFNRKLSIEDATKTIITWPNIPLLVSVDALEKMNYFKKSIAYKLINSAIQKFNEQPFITDSIDNFTISGSKRIMFEDLQKSLGPFVRPWPFKDNMFALLYGKNNSWLEGVDPIFTTALGFGTNQTYRDLDNLKYLNYNKTLPYWKSTPAQCNVVNGTEGEFFSPFIDQKSDLYVYSPELCRKIKLNYQKNIYISGIDSMSFAFDKKNFLSYKNESQNECFCLERDPQGLPLKECDYDGLMDLSTCVQPNIVASTANFYGASEKLLKRVDGMLPPIAEKHLGRLLIEPNSGITLRIYTPFQFNVRMRKNWFKNFELFNDEEPLIVPLTWVVETSTMSEEQSRLLKSKLYLLDKWLVTSLLGGFIIAIVAIIISVIILVKKCRNPSQEPSEEDPLLTPQDNE